MKLSAALLAAMCLCCEQRPAPSLGAEKVAPALPSALPTPIAKERSTPRAARAPDLDSVRDRYAWLQGAQAVPTPVDTLAMRFATPDGYTRVSVSPDSFASFLRTLPLAAPGTPVQSFNGRGILEPGDPRYAAVVALDVGTSDLQQCADAVMRLHAEWRWSTGARDMSYRAAAGLPIVYSRYRRGDRLVPDGASLSWRGGASPSDSYATFRNYLNAVFAWANTVSLEKQSTAVAFAELRAGDFFVLPGNPGHSVLILDLAMRGERKAVLLGQSYMPAQNFQVLRPHARAVWFELDPDRSVNTPFWQPFPWTSLRRL